MGEDMYEKECKSREEVYGKEHRCGEKIYETWKKAKIKIQEGRIEELSWSSRNCEKI